LNGYLEVTRALLPHGTTAINETGEFDNKLTNQERLLDVLRLFEQKKKIWMVAHITTLKENDRINKKYIFVTFVPSFPALLS
jgi:hypothetical protein